MAGKCACTSESLCVGDGIGVEPTVTINSAVAPMTDTGLSESTIIAIGASAGGALCLILSMIALALCVARKRRRRSSANRRNDVDLANVKTGGDSIRTAPSTIATDDDLPIVVAGTLDLPIAVLGSEYSQVPQQLQIHDYQQAPPSTQDMAPLGT
jgi:hypothetical protein